MALVATSCDVERSEKYQTLLAERDSLYTEAVASKGGFDEALNTINEIENALEAVRAQENIIRMENLTSISYCKPKNVSTLEVLHIAISKTQTTTL